VGWVGSVFIILGIWLVGDKSLWGFVFGALGNGLWVYVGLKRGKQYDLAVVALIATVLNIIGLYKWWG
jgi:nicotinamide riboside transporter PnuC